MKWLSNLFYEFDFYLNDICLEILLFYCTKNPHFLRWSMAIRGSKFCQTSPLAQSSDLFKPPIFTWLIVVYERTRRQYWESKSWLFIFYSCQQDNFCFINYMKLGVEMTILQGFFCGKLNEIFTLLVKVLFFY